LGNNTFRAAYFSYIRPVVLFSLDRLRRIGIVYTRLVSYTIDLERELPRVPPRVADEITVRICTDDDFRRSTLRKQLVFLERVKKGQIAMGAFRQGQLVSYLWAVSGPTFETYVEGMIHPEGVYLYDAYTVPEVRGMGIGKAVLYQSLRYAYETIGVKKACSMTGPDNYPTHRIFDSMGLRPTSRITYIRVYRFSRRIVRPVRKA
jgi:GNAT superfamily N-acetyltransferase